MVLDVVKSIEGVPIRLTDERWYDHILEQHSYMSGFYNEVLSAVENPEFISRGNKGTKIAIVNLGWRRWIHVVYREISKTDGFIISAFIDKEFNKNKTIWKRDN
ncbi:MAG: hypothetical protein ACR2MG_05800 [Pyrinomonadaceae bacterium]